MRQRNRDSGIDLAGLRFEHPVAAQVGRAGLVDGSRDVGAGDLAGGLDEALAGAALADVAAVQQDVAVGAQRVADACEVDLVLLRQAVGRIGLAGEDQVAGAAVADDVDRVDVALGRPCSRRSGRAHRGSRRASPPWRWDSAPRAASRGPRRSSRRTRSRCAPAPLRARDRAARRSFRPRSSRARRARVGAPACACGAAGAVVSAGALASPCRAAVALAPRSIPSAPSNSMRGSSASMRVRRGGRFFVAAALALRRTGLFRFAVGFLGHGLSFLLRCRLHGSAPKECGTRSSRR